jgi:hypothetical protein
VALRKPVNVITLFGLIIIGQAASFAVISVADAITNDSNPLASGSFVIKNEEDIIVDAVLVGKQISLDATIAAAQSGQFAEVQFIAIVEVRNEDDITVDIQWQSGTLSAVEDKELSFFWTPALSGTFSARMLVISSFENPELLSAVSRAPLEVAKDAAELERILEQANDPENGAGRDPADYTFLVYMVGSDLETSGYFATEDIREMMKIGSTDQVNVIVETGGALDALPDENRTLDFTSVQTHKVVRNDLERLRDLGERNMGDPETLADFLAYGVTNFPAEHYAVVLWNDGSGINGFGTDTISGDLLTLEELEGAFSKAKEMTGAQYDIIGFDACLMASIEVMTRLDGYANYMVSSEELEPGWGWDYTSILDSLTEDSKMSGTELGKIIADSYVIHIETKAAQYSDYNSQQSVTMSVVDLSKVGTVEDTLSDLSRSLSAELNDISSAHAFARTIGDTERFGLGAERSSGHVDLSHLSENLANEFPNLGSSSRELQSGIDEAVIYTVSRELHPSSSGISIYMPLEDSSNPENLKFGVPGWSGIARTYSAFLAQDLAPPRVTIDWDLEGRFYGTTQSNDVDRIVLLVYEEAIENTAIEVLSTVEDDITFDSEQRYSFPFDQRFISLCDGTSCVAASMYIERSGSTTFGLFPVRLEAADINSDVTLIYKMNDTGGFSFIGAWPGIDEEGNASRELWPLQDGDRIYSKGYQLDIRSGDEYNDSTEVGFVDVTSSFGPAYHAHEGAFYVAAALCDYSGNCEYSDSYRFINSADD